jgi:prolipoprotein diacylglyceryltransferase
VEPRARRRIGRARPPPPHPAPGLFALYVTGYCAFRIVEELLRVDPAAHVLGLRWNLLLAIAGTAIGAAWFLATQRGPSPSRQQHLSA